MIAPPHAHLDGAAVSVETTETETQHAATTETSEKAATAKPANHAATAEAAEAAEAAAVPGGATVRDGGRSVSSDRRFQLWHASRAAVVDRATGVAALLLPLLLLLPLPLLLLLHRILRRVSVGALAAGSVPPRLPVEFETNWANKVSQIGAKLRRHVWTRVVLWGDLIDCDFRAPPITHPLPRAHACVMFAQQSMKKLQERMDRDHRPTMVQLHDGTPVGGMGYLTVGDIFRAQAYSNKKGRHFALVHAHDVHTGDVPSKLAGAVVARHTVADKFENMPDMLLTPAAVPTTGAPSSTDVWTLSHGKRKRVDP